MNRVHQTLALAVSVGTAALLYRYLRQAYPTQTSEIERHIKRLQFLPKYVSNPPWWREMADVRGLAPGDKSEPL